METALYKNKFIIIITVKLLYTINNHMLRDESIIDFTLFKLTATI